MFEKKLKKNTENNGQVLEHNRFKTRELENSIIGKKFEHNVASPTMHESQCHPNRCYMQQRLVV